jgi:hypothetical protein
VRSLLSTESAQIHGRLQCCHSLEFRKFPSDRSKRVWMTMKNVDEVGVVDVFGHSTNRLLICTLTSGSRDLGRPRDAHAHPTIERLSSNHDQHTTNPTWPTSIVPACDWMSAAAVSPAEPFLTGRAGEAAIHARPETHWR